MKRLTLCVLVLGLHVSPVFAQEPVAGAKEPAKERRLGLAKPVVMDTEKEVYGEALAGKECVALETVAKDPKAWHNKTIQLRGKITGVCPKKGCWMTLDDGGRPIRVRFNGYKFFVPLDVAGREAAVEGIVEVKVETEAERRHYAQDAGKSAEEIAKIVGDETTFGFTADAVQIGTLPPLTKKEGCCEEGQKKESCCPEGQKKEGGSGAGGGKDCGGCSGCQKAAKPAPAGGTPGKPIQ